ncbi:hypothetical protein GCM10023176_19950 [Micromonospora coerulea]|uniref:General stress protein CsbD n=1 Tax=Micromonospora coerulea TaxID=47856 RepID=A0ABP8SG25_9ACTN|nr:general stress protein CsbD [Micromonospora veneta]
MSLERAKNQVEKVAGPERARLGDMPQNERSEAERVMQRDRAQGRQPGEHVQADAREAREDFTS